MGKKELFPAPQGVTGADAIVATWIFDEARGEKEDAGGDGGINSDGVQEAAAPGAPALVEFVVESEEARGEPPTARPPARDVRAEIQELRAELRELRALLLQLRRGRE